MYSKQSMSWDEDKPHDRIGKNRYYLEMALGNASRSTCLRRKYGAVLVKDDVEISMGYNGSPRGHANCNETGICERNKLNCKKGTGYGNCPAVHAEMNAIIIAPRERMVGSTLYIGGFEPDGSYADPTPCPLCARMLVNAGVENVIGVGKDGRIVNMKVRDLKITE